MGAHGAADKEAKQRATSLSRESNILDPGKRVRCSTYDTQTMIQIVSS